MTGPEPAHATTRSSWPGGVPEPTSRTRAAVKARGHVRCHAPACRLSARLNVQLYPGPESSIADLPLQPEDFVSHEAISAEVRVGTLSAGGVWHIPGTSAHLIVDGHDEVLAFIHLAPEAYAQEPTEWRNRVGLAIADKMLRRMHWLGSLPTRGTPLPDFAGALPGDDDNGHIGERYERLPGGSMGGAQWTDRIRWLASCSNGCFIGRKRWLIVAAKPGTLICRCRA